MKINDKEYSYQDVLRRCSNTACLYGARRIRLAEGMEDGIPAIDVRTAAGLRFLIREDRCLDIAELSFQGVNIGYLNKNGFVSNAHSDLSGRQFGRYWTGGMLSTCGLRNTGEGCEMDGEFFPPHGRIGFIPARNVSVQTTPETITITGTVREASLFGECFDLHRTIVVPVDGSSISIRDEVYNATPNDEPVFVLYHMNFGFPFLDEGLQFSLPKGQVLPRTELAAQYMDVRETMVSPLDNEPEQVFFYLPDSQKAEVTLSNPRLVMQAVLRYDSQQLPVLSQWRCMRSGDYVLGIEPGTSMIRGRKEELANGYHCMIPAYDRVVYQMELEFTAI